MIGAREIATDTYADVDKDGPDRLPRRRCTPGPFWVVTESTRLKSLLGRPWLRRAHHNRRFLLLRIDTVPAPL
jgi:hypothetical protein